MQARPTVKLTRAHRDAIRNHIALELDGAGDLGIDVERGDKDNARAVLRCLNVCLNVLDEIGWEEYGDRDTYRLELDDDIALFINQMAEVVRSSLEDYRRELHASGDLDEPDDCYEQAIETTWRLIDRNLDALDAARLAREALNT